MSVLIIGVENQTPLSIKDNITACLLRARCNCVLHVHFRGRHWVSALICPSREKQANCVRGNSPFSPPMTSRISSSLSANHRSRRQEANDLNSS